MRNRKRSLYKGKIIKNKIKLKQSKRVKKENMMKKKMKTKKSNNCFKNWLLEVQEKNSILTRRIQKIQISLKEITIIIIIEVTLIEEINTIKMGITSIKTKIEIMINMGDIIAILAITTNLEAEEDTIMAEIFRRKLSITKRTLRIPTKIRREKSDYKFNKLFKFKYIY